MAIGQLLQPMFETVDAAACGVRRRRRPRPPGGRCWSMRSASRWRRMAVSASPFRFSTRCCGHRRRQNDEGPDRRRNLSGGDAGDGECGARRARSAACRRHAGRQAECRCRVRRRADRTRAERGRPAHGAAAAGPGHGEQAPARTCDRRAGPGDRRHRAGRDRGDGAGGLWTGARAPAGTDGLSPRGPEAATRTQRGRDTAGA